MAFVKPARQRNRRTATQIADTNQPPPTKRRNRRELIAIRALGLFAVGLGLVALVLVTVIFLQGKTAGNNAETLLEAYRAQVTAVPVLTPTPALATASPDTGDEFEQTDEASNLSAAANANEHRADDSDDSAIESGEYVQPDSPDSVSDLDAQIEKIIKATGEGGVIGILEIPELDQELPIIGKWSYDLLRISVCRYQGPKPNQKGNLVIIGHNYRSGAHFGGLKNLSVGSELYLTDTATGTRVRYVVYSIKTIDPDAFSALESYRGDYGLTLLTCKNSGTDRLIVRCERKDAD